MNQEYAQSTLVDRVMFGERVNLETFRTGRVGKNAEEMFQHILGLRLARRRVYFLPISLREIGITSPATYNEIFMQAIKYKFGMLSLEASLFLAYQHWGWEKPDGCNIRFFMKPVQTSKGKMCYMLEEPGIRLDGYSVENRRFHPNEVFVFNVIDPTDN